MAMFVGAFDTSIHVHGMENVTKKYRFEKSQAAYEKLSRVLGLKY